MLKQADSLFFINPKEGIKKAKLAYLSASNANLNTQAAKSLNYIAGYYWSLNDNIEAKKYADKGFKLSSQNQIDSLTGDALIIIGLINYNQANYEAALTSYKQALIYYHKGSYLSRLATAYLNLGICERKLSRLTHANEYYFKAAYIYQKTNDNENLANVFTSVANCFLLMKDYHKSVSYGKIALQKAKLSKNVRLNSRINSNIGYAFLKINQPDSALHYLTHAYQIKLNEPDSGGYVLLLQNMGVAYKMKGQYEKARNYITQSLIIAQKRGMTDEFARGKLDAAELDMATGKYTAALISCNQAENIALKNHTNDFLMDVYALKYKIYLQTSNYKQALVYSKKENEIKDSIFTRAKDQTINELEVKYQTTRKQQDIMRLNAANKLQNEVVAQQKKSIIILIVAGLLLFILFVLLYHNLRLKNKANIRIQTLMQDMHHRVKNNLQILSGLFTMQIELLTDEQTKNTLRENEARLTSMNLIHNKLYKDNSTTQIEMQEYLTNLLHHIKDSFGGGMQSEIELRIDIKPVTIDADKAVAIGLIVNELATNAFKYAFNQTGGEVTLSLKRHGSVLLLSLSDNGKGMNNTSSTPNSFGLKIMNLMARQLNTQLNVKTDNGTHYHMKLNI